MATETLRPNAAGDKTEWTIYAPNTGEQNYEDVDEETSDGNTTCLCTPPESITQVKDLYNLQDPVTIGASDMINSVTVRTWIKSSSATYKNSFYMGLKTGGIEYDDATADIPGTDWTNYTQVWTTNPKTGVAWTLDDIKALQIGLNCATRKIVLAYYIGYHTKIDVVVDFTPSAGGKPNLVQVM